jgi:hypothetical protein
MPGIKTGRKQERRGKPKPLSINEVFKERLPRLAYVTEQIDVTAINVLSWVYSPRHVLATYDGQEVTLCIRLAIPRRRRLAVAGVLVGLVLASFNYSPQIIDVVRTALLSG